MRAFLRRHLPRPVLAFARAARAHLRTRAGDYRHRIAAETATFAEQAEVHDLPPIFHYWSNRYLRPMLEPFGFGHPDAFFHRYCTAAYDIAAEGPRRFASIGAGNCDTEIRLAAALKADGRTNFTIECIELTPAMLKRGSEAAQATGVGAHIVPVAQDFNHWRPHGHYDAVLASHSLHHVVALEALFDAIHRALAPHGWLLTTDIIGRNGHLRWPEARTIVEEFWDELPPGYRFNRQLRRQEDRYEDWDCSVGSFEGIRAQDILPLLVERFHFELFVGFANAIDPFIDRSFGPNFDATAEWDRAFIDRVHARDEAELASGRIKPTHMFAVLRREQGSACRHLRGRSAQESIRWPDA